MSPKSTATVHPNRSTVSMFNVFISFSSYVRVISVLLKIMVVFRMHISLVIKGMLSIVQCSKILRWGITTSSFAHV